MKKLKTDLLENEARFVARIVEGEVVEAMENSRIDFLHMANVLVKRMGASRERSLALTKLEESLSWVNAALMKNGLREYDDGTPVIR